MTNTETILIIGSGLVLTLCILSDRGQSLLRSIFSDTERARLTAFLIVLIGAAVQLCLEKLKAPNAYGAVLLAFNSAIAGAIAGIGWAEKQHSQANKLPTASSRTTVFFQESVTGDSTNAQPNTP